MITSSLQPQHETMENFFTVPSRCPCPWCCHTRAKKDLLLSVKAVDAGPRTGITLTPIKTFIVLLAQVDNSCVCYLTPSLPPSLLSRAVLCSSSFVAAAPVLSSLTSQQISSVPVHIQTPTLLTDQQQGSTPLAKKGRQPSTQLLSPREIC